MTDYLDSYRGKRVLVTGGAGAIGSNLCKALADLGAELVIILDNMEASYKWNIPSHPAVLFVNGDVTDDTSLKRVFNEAPTHIYHLAAFFANQNSVDYPERDLHVNGLGTLKLLEYASISQVERFVYASSGCSIYGSEAPLPLREEYVSMHLTSPYQITKMLGELYCNFFSHYHGMKIAITRFFNSYGPGEVPGQYRNVIPNFVYWAMNGHPLPITGTGEETRDFTYVGDLVDGLLRAGYYGEAVGEAVNLASEREISIAHLAEVINASVGNQAGIRYAPRRKWDTKTRLLASVDKARRLIGYEPNTSFEDGIEATIQWFRENREDIDRDASFLPGTSSAVRGQVTSGHGASPS